MKMIFNCDVNKTHFHNKGFALNLVLKVRFGTRKWPIGVPNNEGMRRQPPPGGGGRGKTLKSLALNSDKLAKRRVKT